MEFKIPKSYTVAGQDVVIEIVESDGENYGKYSQPQGVVKLCNKVGHTPQSETQQLNTFFHELTHSILMAMGEYELNDNEKFVNCFAGFLTEAIRTMKHEDSIKNQIWHDTKEKPEIDRNILLVAPNGNSSLALWDGMKLSTCSLGGGHKVLCENDKWAYIDDLINL